MELKEALTILKERFSNVRISYSNYTWKIEAENKVFDFSGKSSETEYMDKYEYNHINLVNLLERLFKDKFNEDIEIITEYKNDLSDIQNKTTNDVRFDLKYNMNDYRDSYFREVYEITEVVEIYAICNIDEFCKRLLKDNLLEN